MAGGRSDEDGAGPSAGASRPAPGTQRPRRFVPRFHWELIACGLRGHELVGTQAARVGPEHAAFVRDIDGVRWYRCLRCDSWIPLSPPDSPTVDSPPSRDEIELPLRGTALRDKFVLRLIAIDRALHFVVLGLLAVAVFLVARNERSLRDLFYRILADIQGGLGGPSQSQDGLLGELQRLFSVSQAHLYETGALIAAYAVLEAVEAVGLWLMKRWAEYLTFVATTALIPLEIYELIQGVSVLKMVALVVNLAIVLYLLWAKRLFGVRGGAKAERVERERDSGWEALDAATPAAAIRA
jgi:uncharacterized membrane protein (DUF2068 family)